MTDDAALRALDKVLAERPDKVAHDFSETLRLLCRFRNDLTAGEELDRVNSVISAVVAGSYPLDAVPWDEIEAARCSFVNKRTKKL